MIQSENKQRDIKENEVDLGSFYAYLSKAIKKLGQAIFLFFNFIFNILIEFLLLIKRNIIWVSACTILGLSIGLYKYYHTGPSYFADMTVSTNFESSRLLYQKIEYFNALIQDGRRKELAKIFNINESDANRLISFDIRPIDDPLQKAKLYRENFLEYKHNRIAGSDTIWTNTIKYKDFISQLTKYDYPLHTIRLYSKGATIYPNVQEGLIKLMHQNASLKLAEEANQEMLQQEIDILNSSLKGLDSLRKAYNNKITSATATSSRETNGIIVGQEGSLQMNSPEIELYDKELILKDELMAAKRRSIEKNQIIQVYSDFNNVGTRVPKIKEDFISYTELGLLIAIIVLLLIRLYKYLNKIERGVGKKELI